MQDFTGALSAIAKTVGSTPEGRFALVKAAWNRAAGELLRDRTRLVGLEDGVLQVAVADKTWQRNMKAHTSELLFKLNSALGSRFVEEIEFIVEPEAFSERPGRKDSSGENTMANPADLPVELIAAAASIKDETLRKQFLSAANSAIGKP